MITSEQVRKCYEKHFETDTLIWKFIDQQEEFTTAVKRYFELDGNYQKSSHEYHEMEYIKNKINEMVGI